MNSNLDKFDYLISLAAIKCLEEDVEEFIKLDKSTYKNCIITERELKKYALIGLLVRIKAEKDRLDKPIDEKTKVQIKHNMDIMTTQYNTLLDELRNEKPL